MLSRRFDVHKISSSVRVGKCTRERIYLFVYGQHQLVCVVDQLAIMPCRTVAHLTRHFLTYSTKMSVVSSVTESITRFLDPPDDDKEQSRPISDDGGVTLDSLSCIVDV